MDEDMRNALLRVLKKDVAKTDQCNREVLKKCSDLMAVSTQYWYAGTVRLTESEDRAYKDIQKKFTETGVVGRWADLKINFLIWDTVCNLAVLKERSDYNTMIKHQRWMSTKQFGANVQKIAGRLNVVESKEGNTAVSVMAMQEFPEGERQAIAINALKNRGCIQCLRPARGTRRRLRSRTR